jgi:LCP family protein required for cell wall assembly
MKNFIIVLFVFLLIITGCNLPNSNSQVDPARTVIAFDPNATITPTPFQPFNATAIPTLTPTPLPPTPTATQPVHSGGGNRPEGQVSILVLGSDWREGGGFRTDVMVVLSINTIQGTITVLSLPRDLWVNIPGYGYNRINVTQGIGGFSMTQNTFQSNFGFQPDHYIITNFDGFKGIITRLNGVNVHVRKSLRDKCKLPQADWEGYCSVEPGYVNMDADFALWYVRSRYSTSDFDRLRRAQEVLEAIFNELMGLNMADRANELYDLFKQSVETDLSLGDLVPLLPILPIIQSDTSRIRQYVILPSDTINYTTEKGWMVLLPIEENFHRIISEAIFTP